MSEAKADACEALRAKLKTACDKCSGLCCAALYCAKTDGFPADRAAGVPCGYLEPDFRCAIHGELAQRKLRGCMAYDCFGAGQKVTRMYAAGVNWRTAPAQADEIFRVFQTVFRLHRMQWYLLEALTRTSDASRRADIRALILENESMTAQPPQELLQTESDEYRQRVNRVLRQVIRELTAGASDSGKAKDYFGRDLRKTDLAGRDLSMTLMIAADLEGCVLRRTCFLGADLRDANLRNADLRQSAFLTQMQINSARGDRRTKLPETLSRPASWRD